MLYIREDIPSHLLKVESLPIDGFYIELKLWSKNWLINCSYNPNRNAIQGTTNLIFACTDFRACKMVLRTCSCTQNYVCKKQSLWVLIYINFKCANWHCFPYIFCHQSTLKNMRQGYTQQKGFSRFNWTSTGELKIDQSRKLG